MTLAADNEKPAGADDDLPCRGDLLANLAGALVTLACVLDRLQFGLEPHFEVAAELDVGAATGHVGGDRHCSGPAGLGDDKRLLLMVAGVEHVVRELVLLEDLGQRFRFLDTDRADQHRLLALPAIEHLLDDRVVFLTCRAIDLVIAVGAAHLLVGRDLDDFELVDVAEFLGLGHRRAGHPGELRIHPEIILEGDRGEGLVLVLDGDAFLGFERLVQAFGIAPAFHHPPGELVDDDDLVVLDDVVGVAREELVRTQRLVDVVDERDVVDVVQRAVAHQAAVAQHRFYLLDPLLGEGHGFLLFVLLEILVDERRDQLVDAVVKLGIVLGGAGDDQRRARLVDQDRIDLVDDRVTERPLDHVLKPELHIVAQIVEAQFVVGAVGDVAQVLGAAASIVEVVDDAADVHAEIIVDLTHPLGVAPGEIVVDRDDVDAVAGERVEIDRQGRDQRLAFAGFHLGDHAAMQHDATHQLHVEMALTEGALRRLAHRRKGFDEQIVELCAVL